MQRVIECLLRLPLSAVLVWCGFNIAAMAWIGRKDLERRLLVPQLFSVESHGRFRNHGVATLQAIMAATYNRYLRVKPSVATKLKLRTNFIRRPPLTTRGTQ
jgi:hypothetical protein